MAQGSSRALVVHVVLISVLGLIVYSNTFHVPFQWDDMYFIAENPIVKDLGYFSEPSRAEDMELFDAIRTRFLGYLSFALNYRVHGLSVTGYHVVNLAIHIANGLLLYTLVLLTLRTPAIGGGLSLARSSTAALFSALLFVCHPVQIEAVTYIFQRFASLATLFYLLSLAAYAVSRLSRSGASRYPLYILSLLSALAAMKTKENAFTLPFALALYELLFLSGKKGRFFWLLPFFPMLVIIPLSLARPDGSVGEMLGASRGFGDIARVDYLFTQFRVLVTYLRLIVLPVNQNIDHDYPVYGSPLNPGVLASLVLLVSMFALSLVLLHRSKRNGVYRMVSFGLLWFFLTISVESSIIPIPMLINEYRLYLPSTGLFTAIVSTLILVKGEKPLRLAVPLLVLLALAFSVTTYARNNLWRTQTGLWKDVVKKSPLSARGYNNVCKSYLDEKKYDMAIPYCETAVQLVPEYPEAHNSLGLAYKAKGMPEKALFLYRTAIKQDPSYPEAHNNLGSLYMSMGKVKSAVEEYLEAIRLRPHYAEAHSNIAVAYRAQGFTDIAIGHLEKAARLKPESYDIHFNLALIWVEKDDHEKAVGELKKVLELNPGDREAKELVKKLSPN